MAGAGRGALYRLRGFASGLNWRPTRFADDVSQYRTCHMCCVLPRRTVLLPCQHSLCEPCHGSRLKDGRVACPIDGEAFEESEWHMVDVPATKVENLKAHCWNEDRGCNFVGNLQAVLQHFEEQCGFHEVACPRCGDSVLNGDLPPRYEPGCSHGKPLATPDQDSWQGSAAALSDVSAELREIEEPLKEPSAAHHVHEGATALAMMVDLETGINELVQQTCTCEETLNEMGVAEPGILEAPNAEVTQAPGKILVTLNEARQAQQSTCSAQQERCAGGGSSASGGSNVDEPPVQPRQESTNDLQKLEGMVSGAVACLEEILQCARLQLALSGKPFVMVEQVHKSVLKPSPLDRMERRRAHFLLTVRNADKLGMHGEFGCTVSAEVKACRRQQSCFTVCIASPGLYSPLEVAFISSDSCEAAHLAKAMTVELRKCGYYYNLPERDGLVPASSGRLRLFYVDPKMCHWWDPLSLDELTFDVTAEE
ncbi:uncharacterized protein LOC144094323 [Amblyomma americanum]